MKKILVTLVMLLGVSIMMAQTKTEKLKVDLTNGDVRHVLIDANKSYGYKLISFYTDTKGKYVMVFTKGTDVKTFVSSK